MSFTHRLTQAHIEYWDRFNAYLTDDGQTEVIGEVVAPSGAPNDNCCCEFWIGPRVAVSYNLAQWAHQQVWLVLRLVRDESYESAVQIWDLGPGCSDTPAAVSTSAGVSLSQTDEPECKCAVGPLKPLTGAKAKALELNPVDETLLKPAMQTALNCLRNGIAQAGGTLEVISAFRDQEYQAHLQEVWKKWKR